MKYSNVFSKPVIGILLATICVVISHSAVLAQSNDKSHPSILTDGSFIGEADTNGQNLYFSFDAGAGIIPISFSGKTDVMNSHMHAVFSDTTGRVIGEFDIPASTDGVKKTVQFRLERPQQVNLKLTLGAEVGVRLNYQISLKNEPDSRLASNLVNAKSANGNQISAQNVPSDLDRSPTNQPSNSDLTAASSSPPNSASNEPMQPVEDKWALIVGISKFSDPKIDLKFPAKDARDLANYLVNEGQFAADHVKLLTDENATKEAVLAEIGDKWLPRVAHPNDMVLIFISTHGSPSQLDLEGVNYLIMHNTVPTSLYATGLPLQDLASAIKQRVHCKRIVVIIDACHSGAAESSQKGITRVTNVDGASFAQGTGQLVICSSKPSQVSWESKRYQNGVFTHQLIEALRAGAGKQSLKKAFDEVKEKVTSEVLDDRKELQEPVLESKWSGDDLILSAPPAKPRKPPAE